MSILDWEDDPVLLCDNEDCGFMTGVTFDALQHAYETGHSITGPGRIEGTTLTVSLERDEDQDE